MYNNDIGQYGATPIYGGNCFFNYRVNPYAPYWSMTICHIIEELDKHEIDVPFDRSARAGVKYEIAEALEYKVMGIFRKIWSQKDHKEFIAEGFSNPRYNEALKQLLLITTKNYGQQYITIEHIKVNTSLENKFKITWDEFPPCFGDTINLFDKYTELLNDRSKYYK